MPGVEMGVGCCRGLGSDGLRDEERQTWCSGAGSWLSLGHSTSQDSAWGEGGVGAVETVLSLHPFFSSARWGVQSRGF